jgi:Ser/Thr protein kinase RdoA (MazF antagonist)
MSLLKHSPNFNSEEAAKLTSDLYGIEGVASRLPSERDQNFLLTSNSGDRFVLKIANSLERRVLLEAQDAAMSHLEARLDFCPRIVKAHSGDLISQVTFNTGPPHFVRLLTFIPGTPLASVSQSSHTLRDLGNKLGSLTRALSGFDHKAFHREFHWNLANAVNIVREHGELIKDKSLRKQIDQLAAKFQLNLGPHPSKLPRSVIHGDANDYNVIVEEDKVVGLIDFGDMIYSYTVGELAIAIAYVVLDKNEPLACAEEVVSGYVSEWSLNEDEFEALWWLMLMRLCMSVCLAEHQQRQRPENEYLDISQQSIRNSLPKLLRIDPNVATDVFRHVMRCRTVL